MSLFYTMAYWPGFTSWEHAAIHVPAVRHITALFEREEAICLWRKSLIAVTVPTGVRDEN
jgi:hypothetical protein